ncbi:MAG: hypothetical protein MZW92_36240 [Comamonadaceae bacterium]|nr:hypothetical protein [Comamonadaceae bacterium]
MRTRKGFPGSRELPVFVLENYGDDEDWVALNTRWDDPAMWRARQPALSG